MLRIRLQRVGARNQPHFRIVVTNRQSAAKSGAIAVIGQYRPDRQPKLLVLDTAAAKRWIGNGAQPTDTVHNLLVDQGVLKEKRNIKYARAKAVEETPAAPLTPDRLGHSVRVRETAEGSSESAAVEPAPSDTPPDLPVADSSKADASADGGQPTN